jgi:hypothetical protein
MPDGGAALRVFLGAAFFMVLVFIVIAFYYVGDFCYFAKPDYSNAFCGLKIEQLCPLPILRRINAHVGYDF